MPKEYVNYPNVEEIMALQESLSMSESEIDGKLGPKTHAAWVEALEADERKIAAPTPVVGFHWDGKNGTVQLSLDVDWDVLQLMVDARRNLEDAEFGDDTSLLQNRVTFYTAGLERKDLNQLIRSTRRARNGVMAERRMRLTVNQVSHT